MVTGLRPRQGVRGQLRTVRGLGSSPVPSAQPHPQGGPPGPEEGPPAPRPEPRPPPAELSPPGMSLAFPMVRRAWGSARPLSGLGAHSPGRGRAWVRNRLWLPQRLPPGHGPSPGTDKWLTCIPRSIVTQGLNAGKLRPTVPEAVPAQSQPPDPTPQRPAATLTSALVAAAQEAEGRGSPGTAEFWRAPGSRVGGG